MNNKWISYLRDELINESDLVLELLKIDKEVQGDSCSYNGLIVFLEKSLYNIDFYNRKFCNTDKFLVEGNTYELVLLLSDLININSSVTICKNNLAINKWILKKYEEFCLNNNYCIASVVLSDYFTYSNCDLYILGSESFYNELCEDFNNNVNIIKL